MLLIYTHRATNRVKYIFNVIFRSVLGVEYEITSNPDTFKQYNGAKFSYTTTALGNELFIQSSELLFENGVKDLKTSFTGKTKEVEILNDDIALAFFLVTRYEEYAPFTPDSYGRFSARQSYAYNSKFLHKPQVNILAKKLQEKITAKYPAFIFSQKKYSYTPTIDIDNAYAYLGKNSFRTLGGYLRAAIKSNTDDFVRRKNTLSGKEKDPYDTYDFQFGIHKKYNLQPIYFFLLGDWAPNDKNLPYSSPLMESLVKKISLQAEIGIHPSFASNQNHEKVKLEKKRLEKIKNASVTKSRQHFLKLRFPETYRNLIASGITDDYTMGFADEIGFRAGICTPYKWYDLEEEEETSLMIHPFAIMDGTLNNYLKLSPEEALEKAAAIIKEIRNVDGEFISIWHNETLSDWKEWKGWKTIYEKIIQLAT